MEIPVYDPLPSARHIRLLRLSPSTLATANIICTTEPVSLDDEPMYEAVSWEWGDTENTETIRLNGLQRNVPKNLAEALRQYRQVDEPRPLWADAICINQADLLERSRQICLMHDIYRKATVVQVWLGPMLSDRDLDVLPIFETLAQGTNVGQLYRQGVVRSSAATRLSLEPWWETDARDDTDIMKVPDAADGLDLEFFDKLLSLFELGWWSRVWVLQEVVVAQTVLLRWGNMEIALPTLFKAHEIMKSDVMLHYDVASFAFGEEKVGKYLSKAAITLELIQYLQNLQSAAADTDPASIVQEAYSLLIETLALCRTHHASDPRDHLYGLLGMLSPEISSQIQPSYLQPESRVFADLACKILEGTKSLMLFSCLSPEDEKWIPGFNQPYFHRIDFHVRMDQQQIFSAGAGLAWEFFVTPDNELGLNGIRIDTLAYVERLEIEPTDAFNIHVITRDWSECYLNERGTSSTLEAPEREQLEENSYPNGSAFSDAICQTLLNDCVPMTESGKLIRARHEDTQVLQDWISYMDSLKKLQRMSSSTMAHSEGLRLQSGCKAGLCKTIRSNIRGKGFFCTRIGYMGFAPHHTAQVGDEVWIIAGASHPVILRRIGAEKSTCKAVTEAYVQGIMDGEISRGQCPILPSDGNAEQIKKQCAVGRKSWPIPQWADIRII